MSKLFLKIVMFVGFCFACFAPAVAQQTEAHVECRLVDTEGDGGVVCDLRLSDPVKIKRFSLTADGQKVDDAKFDTFDDLNSTSAWLFLIDRSNSKRSKTVQSNIDLVKSIVRNARSNQSFGIATFAGELKEIVSLGDRNADYDRRLGDVQADGQATEFFATALEGIRLLSEYEAGRKALVILSDGKAEDKAYKREDVVKAAREANVIIYGMGFAERPSETPDLQILKRLAEETDGPYAFTDGTKPFPEEFLEDFRDYLENGGQISSELTGFSGATNLELDLELQNGEDLKHTQIVALAAVEQPEPAPLSAVAEIYKSFDSLIPGASDWAEQNQGLAGFLLLVAGLLVLGLLYLLFGRNHSDDEVEPATGPISNGDGGETTQAARAEPNESERPAIGYFEFLDDQSQRFEICETSIRIGRHSDNDFQLNNDSVHRHHAHFHLSPQKIPVIADLDTVNGVLVNDERITKTELSDGDVIQLGEVRFRFVTSINVDTDDE